MCHRCRKQRRAAIEMVDPKTEEPHVYCEPCAQKVALSFVFRTRQLGVRHVHADDAALSMVVTSE